MSEKMAFTSVCRECRKEVSVWDMELEPEWICYNCLDKEELNNLRKHNDDHIIQSDLEGYDIIQGHDPGDEND